MISYLIESTLCMAVLFAFYHVFLRNIKILVFNRFYLLFSLVFALTVPFIKIKTNLDLPVSQGIKEFSSVTVDLVQEEVTGYTAVRLLTFQNILLSIYLIISLVFLLRFLLNIFKIIRTVHIGRIVDNAGPIVVMVEKATLPYSFLGFIFVNRFDYEKGNIPKELIKHERMHCAQFHSIDVLILELVKIVLWFNPLIWFYGKAMQLNHEYLADDFVVTNHDPDDYQHQLVNLVYWSNYTCLASSFNYSLTKKRLAMLTKNNPSARAIIRKIASVPLFIILAIVFTFSQENIPAERIMDFENQWWYPILKKHNVEPQAFNNFERVFEMGTTNSINNGIVRLEDAFILIRTADSYMILRSLLAHHNLNANIITADEGTIEEYDFDMDEIEPIRVLGFKYGKLEVNETGHIHLEISKENELPPPPPPPPPPAE